MNIFDLAARQAEWLSLRRAHVASNIANANTSGYQARDVISFEDFPQRTAAPSPMAGTESTTGPDATSTTPPEDPLVETLETGNSVNLDNELMKAGDISRSHALNVGMVRAFHRMLMMSSRG
jgi:flagellar basal-body rod protein FlgB